MKGNPFATLQCENLNQIAIDVNSKLGNNSSEFIISNLVSEDQKNFVSFTEEHPKTLPPSIADLEYELGMGSVKSDLIVCHDSPILYLKDDSSPPLWTEVVRKGKARSKSINVQNDDRRLLEY
jgi:hypothetical protein